MQHQGYFRALHAKSKRRWGLSVLLTILALFPVPMIALILDVYPRWCGVIIACTFAVGGKAFGWWGGTIGAEADGLQRMTEYHRNLGWPIDRKKIADLCAKYSGLKRSAKKRTISGYHEDRTAGATDDSGLSMANMFMESSWWTERLAQKTGSIFLTLLIAVVVLSGFLIIYSWFVDTSAGDGIIGFVVVVFLTMDLIILRGKYVSLQRTASSTYDRLQTLVEGHDVSIARNGVLIAVNDYLIARSIGPPIPETVYKWYQSRLNELWNRELSSGQR